MHSRIAAGALAGIPAGVVFGAMMQLMSAPTPEGGSMPVMEMVAMVVGSHSLTVGWLYHLFNSATIGAMFGVLFGGKVHHYGAGAGWGVGWGVFWWILGGLILMPVLLGMPAFASLRMPPMRMVALGSLIGHLVFGLMLGVGFAWLRRGSEAPHVHPMPA
jgi:hypothetical protein